MADKFKTLAEMAPYGGKYVNKRREMKADQTQNVKKLMTSDDAYSPEKMYVVTRGTKKDSRSRPTRIFEKTDLTAKKAADNINKKGINIRAKAVYNLSPKDQETFDRSKKRKSSFKKRPIKLQRRKKLNTRPLVIRDNRKKIRRADGGRAVGKNS
tara:strand:- start:171 stop:635 length:465 start_codon:yes stop_codon:yes gene_type:complete